MLFKTHSSSPDAEIVIVMLRRYNHARRYFSSFTCLIRPTIFPEDSLEIPWRCAVRVGRGTFSGLGCVRQGCQVAECPAWPITHMHLRQSRPSAPHHTIWECSCHSYDKGIPESMAKNIHFAKMSDNQLPTRRSPNVYWDTEVHIWVYLKDWRRCYDGLPVGIDQCTFGNHQPSSDSI
jgi:hypothetical protein